MSCGHGGGYGHFAGYGGCGCYRGDWADEAVPRFVQRDRFHSRLDEEPAGDALEMRLEGLLAAVRRVETEMADLRARGEAGRTDRSLSTEP